MAELGIDELVVSDYALREGVLLDALDRGRGGALHHLHDLRRRSVLHLAELMDDDPDHSAARRRARPASCSTSSSAWHGLGDDARELLEAAALLANVGLFVSHAEHHKHSYYVIRNSDHLAGFTDHEIELIALVARYHRKSAPKPKHPEFAALRPGDQDRGARPGRHPAGRHRPRPHPRRPGRAACGQQRRRRRTLAHRRRGRPTAPTSPSSCYTADERKGLLEDVLGRRVEVELAGRARRRPSRP